MRGFRRAVLVSTLCLWGFAAQGYAQPATWTISESPTLSIGEADAPPGGDLFGVVGVVHLSDGHIVVADRGQRLLVYTEDGEYVRTIGRVGEGPGEFQAISVLSSVPGDTLVVFDLANYRLSFFTVDDGFVNSASPRQTPPPRYIGTLSDGTQVAWGGVPRPDEIRGPISRSWGELIRVSSEGEQIGTIAAVPRAESLNLAPIPRGH